MSHFTLEYWLDEDWYVGRLKEVPGVFSQGETLEDLEKNIIDAYKLVRSEYSDVEVPSELFTKDLAVQI